MTPATAVENWVHNFVLRYQLCPFAYTPVQAGRVRYVEVSADSVEEAYRLAGPQVQGFVEEQGGVDTTLLVFPSALDDFDDFLDLVYALEHALGASGVDELVQLAHFHPNYRFADVSPDDPGNLTNRAPYPVVQLLRVADVAAAAASYPNVEEIPERNVQKMRELFG